MAIYFVRTRFLSRTKGYNVVHSAAYRRATLMTDAGNRVTYNYSRKTEVAGSGIAYPDDVPEWFKGAILDDNGNTTSARFWNFVEDWEKNKHAQLASETVIAVPRELTPKQAIEFANEYAREMALEGFFVDWAFHNQGVRGEPTHHPHLHVMMSLRPMIKSGFGPKKITLRDSLGEPIRRDTEGGSRIEYVPWAGDNTRLRERNKLIEQLINKHLALAGLDICVDCRSNAEKRNDVAKSCHLEPPCAGSQITEPKLQGVEAIAEEICQRIRANPSIVFDEVAEERASFSKRHFYSALNRYGFSSAERSKITNRAFKSDSVLRLERPEAKQDPRDVRYATLDMIAAEKAMLSDAMALANMPSHRAGRSHTERALKRYAFLSEEQKSAVHYLTDAGSLKNLVGRAGTGKSTLLKAAHEAWHNSGYQVRGVALAGKAAEELKSASDIASQTLASLLTQLKYRRTCLQSNEVIVLDEAGMVGSRDMAELLSHVREAGAKLVLVGDPNQLPAISAGAAFRAICENAGCNTIETIRRQQNPIHRKASQSFAQFDTKAGLAVYEKEGVVHGSQSLDEAIYRLALSYVEDHQAGRKALALSYRNKDVRALNYAIRTLLAAEGHLENGIRLTTENRQGERFENDYAKGDEIVFLQNDKRLGVTNGTSATLVEVSKNRITARVGDRTVEFDPTQYRQFTHGYAVTIHKSQGMSVDHVHLLASPLMDRNLTYVGMTRHKESVSVHYDKTAFPNGLSERLGHANDKTSTLDYITKEDVVDFGANLGFDTRSVYARIKDFVCHKVEGVWKKVTKSETERTATTVEKPTSKPAKALEKSKPVPAPKPAEPVRPKVASPKQEAEKRTEPVRQARATGHVPSEPARARPEPDVKKAAPLKPKRAKAEARASVEVKPKPSQQPKPAPTKPAPNVPKPEVWVIKPVTKFTNSARHDARQRLLADPVFAKLTPSVEKFEAAEFIAAQPEAVRETLKHHLHKNPDAFKRYANRLIKNMFDRFPPPEPPKRGLLAVSKKQQATFDNELSIHKENMKRVERLRVQLDDWLKEAKRLETKHLEAETQDRALLAKDLGPLTPELAGLIQKIARIDADNKPALRALGRQYPGQKAMINQALNVLEIRDAHLRHADGRDWPLLKAHPNHIKTRGPSMAAVSLAVGREEAEAELNNKPTQTQKSALTQ